MLNPDNRISRRQAIGVLATPLLTPILASCGADGILSPKARPSFAADDLSMMLIGAGDPHAKLNIGTARQSGKMIQTMLNQNPEARAFVVGDCTEHGTVAEYQLYHSTWGSFKDRTDFQIGNHDLLTDPSGAAYYDYAGEAAGPRGKGYYAKNYGSWRVYYLNSQIGKDVQAVWLANDLPNWSGYHIMAMWHQPQHASICKHAGKAMTHDHATGPWWDLLVKYGAELVLSGHVHRYERFARLLRDGTASDLGIRQFIVGTGGAGPMNILTVNPHCEYNIVARGVFKLSLYGDRYEWEFTDFGGVVRDTGSQACRKVLV